MFFSMANKKNELVQYVIVVLAMAFYAGSVRAQESVPVSAEEITVTATRVEEPITDVPQQVEIVSPAELLDRLPRTVSDALRDELGLWIIAKGHAAGTPVLRGLTGTRILPLIDGVRINNSQLKGTPNQLLNQLNLDAVERIEILKGPAAVQYGSDAIGGVINIITKKSNMFPETPRFGASLRGLYATADQADRESVEASYDSRLFNLDLGGTLADVDDVKGGGDLGKLEPSSYKERHFFVKNNFRISEKKVFGLSYMDTLREDITYYDQSRRNVSGIPRTFRPIEVHNVFQVSYEASRISRFFEDMRIYVSYQIFQNTVYTTTESSTKLTRVRRARDENMFNTGIQMTSPVGLKSRLIYGLDYRYDDMKEDKEQYVTTKSTGAIKTTAPTDGRTPDGTYDTAAMFAILEYKPVDRLKLSASLRYETEHLDSAPEEENLITGFTISDIDVNKRWHAVTGGVGAVYSLGAHTDVTADIATGFRSPNYADVLKFDASNNGISVPSPDVDPEQSISCEIGTRLAYDKWTANTAVFYTSLTDMIDSEATNNYIDLDGDGKQDSDERTYIKRNIGSAYVYGIESKAELKLRDNLKIFGNFALVVGQDTENDVPLQYIPPANGTIGIRWEERTRKMFWTELSVRVADKQSRINPDEELESYRSTDTALKFPDAANPPLREDFSIPGYTIFNLRAGVPVSSRVDINIAVENLFNKKYREAFSDMDAAGLNMIFGIEARW
ncbi:MAG: TonB-dependent receptor [Planctomycetes bacterium]|nr:TonB-dependent receptor [Planctomycetota bacterium]